MLINRKFGEYVLLQRLAVGGQSEVFLALKVGPGDFLRTVVIKVLPSRLKEDDRFVRLFFKEAFVSSRFAHPNVITVHDAKLIEGDYCLVMDFVAGQTVADIAQRGFKSGQPLSLNQSIQIIADACDGLHYAHQFRDLDESTYSIVHCDISPQNLMVTYQGVTRVFDFGIAHIPGYEGTNEPLTVGGKYAYMSPEQLRGEDVDARSDIFSLGIILYELCTGYRLFRRGSQPEVIKAVCEEPIRPPTTLRPDLPMFLERVVMRALERDPRRRYRTAAEMRDDLLQLLSMMSKGSERASLGEYVASLFVDERKDVADVLRQANQGMLQLSEDMSEGFVERLTGDFAPFEEQTMELDPQAFKEFAKAKEEARRAVEEANNPSAKASGDKRDDGDDSTNRAAETARLEREKADAVEQAMDLSHEVAKLQRRQTLLWIMILVLGAIAIVLGVLQIQGGAGKSTGPDVEVSSTPSS